MTQTFVLRLVADALADGRIAGRVEAVESGDMTAVAEAGELVAFLLSCGRRAAELGDERRKRRAGPDPG